MKKAKIIYFCDIPMNETPKEEWKMHAEELKGLGLDVGKVECVTIPPFDKHFDILFFDWGGMSMGNSLLESFCREVLRLADDNPSRMFVMASFMTKDAMNDAQHREGLSPKNVYLTFEEFILACRDQGLVKKKKLAWK